MSVGLFTTEIYANWGRRKNWRGGFSYLLTAQKLKRKINPPDN